MFYLDAMLVDDGIVKYMGAGGMDVAGCDAILPKLLSSLL
jgi:hypothetical protein